MYAHAVADNPLFVNMDARTFMTTVLTKVTVGRSAPNMVHAALAMFVSNWNQALTCHQ